MWVDEWECVRVTVSGSVCMGGYRIKCLSRSDSRTRTESKISFDNSMLKHGPIVLLKFVARIDGLPKTHIF